MVKKQASTKATSLFDIRLKNLDHDVLVLKGPAQDAASALMVGKIVLSLNEPIHVKKISLRLYATLHLKWTEPYQTSKGVVLKPMKFSKKIYEHTWDPSELKQKVSGFASPPGASGGIESTSSTSPTISRQHSTTSLKAFGSSFRSKSSSNLSNLHLTSSSSSNLAGLSHSHSQTSNNHSSSSGNTGLGQGNHEIPFSAILPGDMPESVEGLPGGSVVYKLEAVIERGKFHAPLVTKRHVRVIRTLTTDAVELSETVAVDNTWPGKVEYSLNVPSKAIAIGTQTPVSFTMVPLLKGLRLGDIKIQLVEYFSYLGYLPPAHNDERILTEKFIPRPHEEDPNFFGMDRWEVDASVNIPNTLSKCTQDCDIQSHMKVRHKLKFVIGLVNPDGHVSELRASLPIQLFISPFVTIKAKYDDDINDSNSDSHSFDDNRHKSRSHGNDEEEDEEELLFLSDLHSGSHTSLNHLADRTNGGSGVDLAGTQETTTNAYGGFIAPPIYEKHVYDVLWSDVSPIESPIVSGSATPRSNYHTSDDISQHFSMSSLDTQKLSENLRQLSLQRQLQESNSSTPSTDQNRNRATFNLDDENQNEDYFSVVSNPHSLETPGGVLSPPTHLSRVGSENLVPEKMVKVPSYTQAIRSDLNEEPLSPDYEPPLPGSNINLVELSRRFEEMQQHSHGSGSNSRSRLILSRGSSGANLKSLGGSSRNSSGNSSPSNSRSHSYSNLTISPIGSLANPGIKKGINSGNSGANSSGNSSTNISASNPQIVNLQKPQESHPPELLKLSSSASDRSAIVQRSSLSSVPLKSSSSLNLQNLPFLHKKK